MRPRAGRATIGSVNVLKRDYYDVLGLSRDADDDAIQRAFHALARQFHPDVADDPSAEDRFRELRRPTRFSPGAKHDFSTTATDTEVAVTRGSTRRPGTVPERAPRGEDVHVEIVLPKLRSRSGSPPPHRLRGRGAVRGLPRTWVIGQSRSRMRSSAPAPVASRRRCTREVAELLQVEPCPSCVRGMPTVRGRHAARRTPAPYTHPADGGGWDAPPDRRRRERCRRGGLDSGRPPRPRGCCRLQGTRGSFAMWPSCCWSWPWRRSCSTPCAEPRQERRAEQLLAAGVGQALVSASIVQLALRTGIPFEVRGRSDREFVHCGTAGCKVVIPVPDPKPGCAWDGRRVFPAAYAGAIPEVVVEERVGCERARCGRWPVRAS